MSGVAVMGSDPLSMLPAVSEWSVLRTERRLLQLASSRQLEQILGSVVRAAAARTIFDERAGAFSALEESYRPTRARFRRSLVPARLKLPIA
jgi:hypothetical protein